MHIWLKSKQLPRDSSVIRAWSLIHRRKSRVYVPEMRSPGLMEKRNAWDFLLLPNSERVWFQLFAEIKTRLQLLMNLINLCASFSFQYFKYSMFSPFITAPQTQAHTRAGFCTSSHTCLFLCAHSASLHGFPKDNSAHCHSAETCDTNGMSSWACLSLTDGSPTTAAARPHPPLRFRYPKCHLTPEAAQNMFIERMELWLDSNHPYSLAEWKVSAPWLCPRQTASPWRRRWEAALRSTGGANRKRPQSSLHARAPEHFAISKLVGMGV